MKLLTFEQGLRPRDRALVAAFAEREVLDFRAGWDGTPLQVQQYVDAHMRQIDFLLRTAPAAEEIQFHSLGNAGCIIRELRIEPKKYDFGNGFSQILIITFSPCGPQAPVGLQIIKRKWK